MAYRFERGEPVPEAIRRMAGEQLEAAVESLRGRGNRDEAIHDARKRVKKTRALLRLVRSELGDRYTEESTCLREAGRGLSEFRDAAAVIGTFDELVTHYRDDLDERPLASIRRGLAAHKARAEREPNRKQKLQEIVSVLAATALRAGKWELAVDGFAAIGRGLQQTFRSSAKAMREVRRHPHPETYHEWRKRVKDHWYHTRLLEDLWSEVMGGYERSLKQLEDWLGNDHNLDVLRSKLTAEPGSYGDPKDIETLLSLAAKQEKELRDCALAMGGRVYLEDADSYRRRLHGLWDAWRPVALPRR